MRNYKACRGNLRGKNTLLLTNSLIIDFLQVEITIYPALIDKIKNSQNLNFVVLYILHEKLSEDVKKMKSFFVSLVAVMFLSAVYVFQNAAIVNVRFFVFNFAFSQGLYEVAIFAFGAALMWFFSIFSYFENRAKYKEELAERVAEVRQLEGANKVLLDTLSQNSIANPLEVVTETQGTN